MKMTYTYVTAWRWVTAPAPNNVARDGMLGLAGRGNSATKRAATVAGSGYADDSSGSAAINDANLWVAAPPGNPDNLAASCHGSMSNRARAESTLSSIPLLSSRMGANRKLSNSGPSCENLVIASTELHRLYRRQTSHEVWTFLLHVEKPKNIARQHAASGSETT
jgi:hypothetical protein